MGYKLLGTNSYKTSKGEKKGYLTGILYMSPADMSGRNVCPWASRGCRSACLNSAGRGGMNVVQRGRLRKTNLFFENRKQFLADLRSDINALIRKAERENMIPCVRLNGTSDIPFEKVFPNLFQEFSQVQFYDYTKAIHRLNRDKLPTNYHLTFSRSEDTTEDEIRFVVDSGFSVAVVFDALPDSWLGIPVYDADETDLRFLDDIGIAGLTPKGKKGREDETGFVVKVSEKIPVLV